jgi:ammonium transporter, Amt family
MDALTPVASSSVANINPADVAWLLCASSLVMLMTPAVGLFYGGMVRRKNLLSTVMLSFSALVLMTLQWVLFGYSLAFGPDVGHVIGGLDWLGLNGVGLLPFDAYSKTLPHLAYMMFQMKFAIIAPALITGAFVDMVHVGICTLSPLDLGHRRLVKKLGGAGFCRGYGYSHFCGGGCHGGGYGN